MIYAQIKNGIIQNIIDLEDASLIPLFSQGFDFFVDITKLQPYPSPGHSYDGNSFSLPPPPPPIVVTEDKIQRAIDGFNKIMLEYIAQNVLSGITQAGKTQLIADTLATVQRYGQSGSLYAAIAALKAIQLTPDMDPFLNATVVNTLITQAQDVLNSL